VEGDAERVLQFAASHDLVLAAQIRAFLRLEQTAAQRAVDALLAGGCLARVGLGPGLAGFATTPQGREALCPTPVPRPVVVDRAVRARLGAVWVWIRSRDGRFPDARVLSAREALAHDLTLLSNGAQLPRSERYGLRIGGVPSRSATGLHYPEVLLQFHDGWCAVHLQLSPVGQEELVARLRSYGADERYGKLVFVVERERVARQVERAALSAGVADVTLVRWMEWS